MMTVRRALTCDATVLVAFALLAPRDIAAQAPGYEVLYSFQGGTDGSGPNGVTIGKGGALYGTTYTGGRNLCEDAGPAFLCGTVFELAPPATAGGAWTKKVLHSFNGADGALPLASLVFGNNGALFGTTANGGSYDNGTSGEGGTVFELAPPATAGGPWNETVLYALSNSLTAPRTPKGAVLIGPGGTLYATAFASYFTHGYPEGGAVFELTSPGGSWTESTLVSLWPATDMGYNPESGVVSAGGSLYGTTYFTYPQGCGAVYELSPPAAAGEAWTGTAIHTFSGADGCNPFASLTVGPGGVLFGTTISGGVSGGCLVAESIGCGTVFQLTPPPAPGGAWAEAVIHSFTALNGDGAYPVAGVVFGKDGVLYGTTTYGGSAISGSPCSNDGPAGYGPMGCGTVFELTPPTTTDAAWTETVLHSFTGQDGEGSIPGTLILSPGGALFGPTELGGTAGHGTIFALKP